MNESFPLEADPQGNPPRTSLVSALLAPTAVLRPEQAAAQMARASAFGFWLTFAAWIVVHGALMALLVILHHSGDLLPPHFLRSLALRSGLVMMMLVPLLAGFVAWLYLPTVHQGGKGLRSMNLALRSVVSGIGLLAVLIAWVGFLGWKANNPDRPPLVFLTVMSGLLSLCLMFYWLGKAARSVADPPESTDLPPCCEGCGYDLTEQPLQGRCPECGTAVSRSLDPHQCRPGIPWQADEDVNTWTQTVVAVLFSPGRFYQQLKTRVTEKQATRFSTWHFPLIGLGAAFWIAFMFATSGAPGEAPAFAFLFCLLLAPLTGWVWHRLVGCVMTSWFIIRDRIPNLTSTRAVLAYESAFLWAFCLFNGVFISSLFIFGELWVSNLFGAWTDFVIFVFPTEGVIVVLGNGLLTAWWMWRYSIAFRGVRWSNF